MPKGRAAKIVEKSPTAQPCKDNEKEADVDGLQSTFRKEWLTGGGQSTTANHSVTDKGKAAGDGDTKAPTQMVVSMVQSPIANLEKDNEKEVDVDGQPTAAFRKERLTGGGQSTTSNHSVTVRREASGEESMHAPSKGNNGKKAGDDRAAEANQSAERSADQSTGEGDLARRS